MECRLPPNDARFRDSYAFVRWFAKDWLNKRWVGIWLNQPSPTTQAAELLSAYIEIDDFFPAVVSAAVGQNKQPRTPQPKKSAHVHFEIATAPE